MAYQFWLRYLHIVALFVRQYRRLCQRTNLDLDGHYYRIARSRRFPELLAHLLDLTLNMAITFDWSPEKYL
jgi:hypothetical protein